MGVATVASPLSCTNPRHPCQGHWRIALRYSAGPFQHGLAWPSMVPLSLGKHGVGVGVATVAPHSLAVSRLPVQGNGRYLRCLLQRGSYTSTCSWNGLECDPARGLRGSPEGDAGCTSTQRIQHTLLVMVLSIFVGSTPEGLGWSSSASDGSLFLGIPGGGVGVATVASPLSCTNPRHPCQGHRRIALIYSQVH